ncbi:MAG: universal stress protein [Saprospirales bacterium]|nr:universal stress protein [Saprospirales bacterium]
MKKILLPTDFSTYSKVAIQYALELFGKEVYPEEATFVLMHAFSPDSAPILSSSPYVYASPIHRRDVVRNAEKTLAGVCAEYRQQYPKQTIKERLIEGNPAEAILYMAQEEEVDLIVMGTMGMGVLERAVLGSVALGVSRDAHCPVLIVPGEAKFKRPQKLVFATDFRNLEDLHMLDPLRDLVDVFEPHFMLLHIYTEMDTSAEEKTRMNHILQDYFDTGAYSHFFLKRHDPVEGVEEFVEGFDVDLLALVGQERGFFEKLFHKSLTRNMVIHSEIPVFILNRIKTKEKNPDSRREDAKT